MRKSSKELKALCSDAVSDLGVKIHSLSAAKRMRIPVYVVWFSFDGKLTSSEPFEGRKSNRAQFVKEFTEYVKKRMQILYPLTNKD